MSKNSLITLKSYLNDKISTGPNAEPTIIKYDYQDYANIYNYFFITFMNIKEFKIMCINDSILIHNSFAIRAAIAYDEKSNKLYMDEKIKICNCKKNTRFVFINFVIISKNMENNLTHANIIIIDLYKKIVERFEPYGHTSDNKKLSDKIDKIIRSKFFKKLNLFDYSYISPSKISPRLGIQSVADSYNGMCITISMMYLHLRILNPDIKPYKLVNYLLSKPKKKLKKMILQYAKHVEVTLKKNKNLVLELFENFEYKLKNEYNY